MGDMLQTYRGFFLALIPAAIGGAIWAALGLPLAWLMGAAIVTGLLSFSGLKVTLPRPLYLPSLATIGAGVGLTITPSVAVEIAQWFPLMAIMAFAGVIPTALLTPIVARRGDMTPATAFFSLMPGGVIEMANIGSRQGGDPTTISALHAIRVGLVVGILPISLFLLFPATGQVDDPVLLSLPMLGVTITIALLGGWLGEKIRLPATWLLGAILAVGIVTATGSLDGQIHPVAMAIAQVIVGMSLGSKFLREKMKAIPRAIAAGTPALCFIILFMAALGVIFSLFLPMDAPTMVLAFSIGGLAEMVLTARELELAVAIVAAFQAIRAILVYSSAGLIWKWVSKYY